MKRNVRVVPADKAAESLASGTRIVVHGLGRFDCLGFSNVRIQPRHSDPCPRANPGFVRGLGLFDSTMIVVGSMIGSGIFIVSADISRQTGSAGGLLIAWVITGVLTIAAALSYGELAAMMPKAGGQYVYLRESYSPLVGLSVRLDAFSGHSNGNHRRGGRGVCALSRRARSRGFADRLDRCRPYASPRNMR